MKSFFFDVLYGKNLSEQRIEDILTNFLESVKSPERALDVLSYFAENMLAVDSFGDLLCHALDSIRAKTKSFFKELLKQEKEVYERLKT